MAWDIDKRRTWTAKEQILIKAIKDKKFGEKSVWAEILEDLRAANQLKKAISRINKIQ